MKSQSIAKTNAFPSPAPGVLPFRVHCSLSAEGTEFSDPEFATKSAGGAGGKARREKPAGRMVTSCSYLRG